MKITNVSSEKNNNTIILCKSQRLIKSKKKIKNKEKRKRKLIKLKMKMKRKNRKK